MWCSGCNMLLLAFILGAALALPNQGPPAAHPSCIRMTPEKEKQIDIIIEKLGNFLANLTIEHELFDIRLIKLAIEQHTEEEIEEKETLLQLSVNDCQLSDEELEEIDHHKEKAKEHELERQKKEREEAKADPLKKEGQQKQTEEFKENEATDEKKEQNENTELNDDKSKPNFKVMNLDLDENGRELVEALTRRQPKRPLVVYVQRDHGQLDYLFANRR